MCIETEVAWENTPYKCRSSWRGVSWAGCPVPLRGLSGEFVGGITHYLGVAPASRMHKLCVTEHCSPQSASTVTILLVTQSLPYEQGRQDKNYTLPLSSLGLSSGFFGGWNGEGHWTWLAGSRTCAKAWVKPSVWPLLPVWLLSSPSEKGLSRVLTLGDPVIFGELQHTRRLNHREAITNKVKCLERGHVPCRHPRMVTPSPTRVKIGSSDRLCAARHRLRRAQLLPGGHVTAGFLVLHLPHSPVLVTEILPSPSVLPQSANWRVTGPEEGSNSEGCDVQGLVTLNCEGTGNGAVSPRMYMKIMAFGTKNKTLNGKKDVERGVRVASG